MQAGPCLTRGRDRVKPKKEKLSFFFFSPINLLGFGVGQLKPAVKAVGWKKVGTPRRFVLLILLYADCHF